MNTAPLHSPARVRELLRAHSLRPDHALGQNFLIDGNILRAIAEGGGAAPGEHVLEVGPGLGVLTRELAERGAMVTALELDTRLKLVLEETLAGLDVRLVWGDALAYDWASLPPGTRMVANVPYYISTALLEKGLNSGRLASATVLVQREVAERMAAQPGDDAYGYLSALVALHGRARVLRSVPPTAFYPAPEVTSSVVRVDVTHTPPPGLLPFVGRALAHRRKTLRNNLRMAGYAPEALDAGLQAAGLDGRVRAEAVPLDAMEALARALGAVGGEGSG